MLGTSQTPVPISCTDLLSMPAPASAASAADSRGGATGTRMASLPSPLAASASRLRRRHEIGAVGVVELDAGHRAAAHRDLAFQRARHLLAVGRLRREDGEALDAGSTAVVDDAADLRRGGDAHDPDAALGRALVVGEGHDVGAALRHQRRQRRGRGAEQRPQHQGRAVGARLA